MRLKGAIERVRFGQHPQLAAEATIEAINGRDWPRLRQLLTDDFFFLDGEGNRVEPADHFITSMQAMLVDAPDFALRVDDYEEAGHMVYMRGRTTSSDFRYRSHTMWRARVHGGRLQCLQNFRAHDTLRLVDFAGQPA